MEKISWTDRVRNLEVLHTVNEERDILQTLKRGNTNWIGHILGRNCVKNQLLKERKKDERSDGKTKKKKK
jgi:hypothetical protein